MKTSPKLFAVLLLLACAAGHGAAQSFQTIYVNQNAPVTSAQDGTSWANACTNLQHAISNANPTATHFVNIFIATGTYRPTEDADRAATFLMKSNLRLFGGFAGTETALSQRLGENLYKTVLSGDIGVRMANRYDHTSPNPVLNGFGPAPDAEDPGFADNVYNVVTALGVTNVVLHALAISGGYAFADAFRETNAALAIEDMTMPAITLGKLTNITVFSLSALGIVITNVDIKDIMATNGETKAPLAREVAGGGIFLSCTQAPPRNVVNLLLDNVQVVGNYARGYGGGLASHEANMLVTSSRFANNRADIDGGGAFEFNSVAVFEFVDFIENRVLGSGGGLHVEVVVSHKTIFPGINDGVSFEEAFHISPDLFRRILGGSITVYKVVPKLVKVVRVFYTTGFTPTKLWNAGRYLAPAGPWSKNTEALTELNGGKGENISKPNKVLGLYFWVSLAVTVGDIGYALADAFGADMDHPLAEAYKTFSDYFNKYATPQGLATLAAMELLKIIGGGPDDEDLAYDYKQFQQMFYNLAQPGVTLLHTTFTNNSAVATGGGLSCLYDNTFVEDCTFVGNAAFADGGGIYWGGWNNPHLISSVLNSNRSETGESALSNVGHCRARIVNCTIVNNYSDATNGFAVGNQMGSEVGLANSILWNNSNATHTNGGADIFTATKDLLNAEEREFYKDAGPGYGDFVAICDIDHCIIQSLDVLPEGKDVIRLFHESRTYRRTEIDQILEEVAEIEKAGIWEYSGYVNVGQGNRPGTRTKKGNLSSDPLLGPDGITPSASSPAINAGSNFRLNNGTVDSLTDQDVVGFTRLREPTLDIGAVERIGITLYVRTNAPGSNLSGTNWANAMTNLQNALMQSNATILVAEGTYRPSNTGDRNAKFRPGWNNQIYGGFKDDGSQTELDQRDPTLHETILSGDIGVIGDDSDNSYHVVYNLDVFSHTILDGFTITKGRAFGPIVADRVGGGICNVGSSEPQIINCRLVDNRAADGGGALFSQGQFLSGSLIRRCTFLDNQAGIEGGAIQYVGSVLQVENSTFVNNRASIGGAISSSFGWATIIFNSRFQNNFVTGGISESRGGALDARETDLHLQNNTFYRNYISANIAESRGGGAVSFDATTNYMALENNIFWNNFAVNTSAPPASMEKQQITSNISFPQAPGVRPFVVAYNNIIEGLQELAEDPLDGNFDADPQFIDPAGGVLRLASYSPAIDGGRDRANFALPTTDLDGSPRYSSARIDIGAYEFQGTPTPLANDITIARQCNETDLSYSLAYIGTNGPSLFFQWQVNRNDGGGFTNIADGSLYSGVATTNLTISNPSVAMNGYRYRMIVTGVFGLTSETTFITVRPNRFYVRAGGAGTRDGSSWSNAFAHIHDALAAAADCAQIWVAAGTYHPPQGPTPLESALKMRSTVSIYGGFAGFETDLSQRNWRTNLTVISGNLGNPSSNEDDSARLIFNFGTATHPGCDASAILDGFTLRDARNSAMVNFYSSPTVRNCIFVNNRGSIGGAVRTENGAPVFSQCEFRGNYAGNGGAASLSSATNYFVNCVFHGNVSAHLGGGIVAANSVLHLWNNTLADNRASSFGGGIYLGKSQADVRNSIVWGNTHGTPAAPSAFSSQVYESASSLALSNSVVQFGAAIPGGNTAYDPLFTNAPDGDLRLRAQSPAINTGNNADASGWSVDLDGRPRAVGGTVDSGAYEYQGANPTSTVQLLTQPSSVSVCTGSDPSHFTVSGPANGAIYDWEVAATDGPFTAITTNSTYSISVTATSSTLTVTDPTLALNGHLYRAVVRDTGYATPPASLTVNVPTPIFVHWNTSGANDGSSWFSAFTNLHDALNAATPCNEIWVAYGTYQSSGPVLALRPGVKIYGGFGGFETSRDERNVALNKSILLARTNQSVFVNIAGLYGELSRNTVLDGFTLWSSNTLSPVIFNVEVNPTIQNCAFEAPPGTAIYNVLASPLITNCTFVNGRNGAIVNDSSAPAIVDSLFRGNTNSPGGAGIVNISSSPLIDHCQFETNSTAGPGGAIFNTDASSPTISRSTFLGNRASEGGAVANRSSGEVRIENSLFAYNESGNRGGAMDHSQGSLTLLQTTVTENHSALRGGGIYLHDGNLTLLNSILWNNGVRNTTFPLTQEQQQLGRTSGIVAITNTCLQGNQTYTANGNIASDPLFDRSAPAKTFPLHPASPALNAGHNAFAADLAVDLVGAPRVAFGTVDMGAYESTSPAQPPVRLLHLSQTDQVCSGETALFTAVTDASQTDPLQWQVNTGSGFVDVTNDGTHLVTVSGATNTLRVLNVNPTMHGRLYRVSVAVAAFVSPPMTLSVFAPTILYVKASAAPGGNGSSWFLAFTNLQQALNIANHCSEIWVAQGTYPVVTSAINEPYFPLKPGVEIYGGFQGSEALRQSRNPSLYASILVGNTNAPATVVAQGEFGAVDGATVLDGVVIESANGNGIFNSLASPTIRNCTIRNVPRAGIWNSFNSHPLIDNCTFTGNQGGGIFNTDASAPTITGCWFANNYNPSSGGAIANSAANPSIAACVFSNNISLGNGGAIYSDSSSVTTVRRSRFVSNTAGFGGALIIENSESVLEQLVMHGNSAARGGAIYFPGPAVTLVNSTIADNSASGLGSGIFMPGGSVMHLRNSILWGNVLTGGTTTVSNCWMEGAASDPLFVNPLAGNYRLSDFSPLINAGDNAWITSAMTVDLDGNPRLHASTVDIGAYELPSAAQTPLLISSSPVAVLAGCSGNDAVFSVAGTISGSNVVWQLNQGSGFADVAGPSNSVAAISTRSELIISGLPPGTNYQVRYRLTENAFTSAPVRLVINSPPIVYVNQAATGNNNGMTWAHAFTNLQTAISSSDCVEIWVAAGTYAATESQPSFRIRSTVAVYGGFSGTETARAQRNWTNNPTILATVETNSAVVLNDNTVAEVNASAILDGFIIDGIEPLAAMMNLGASPTIRNCSISGQAGFAVFNEGGSPSFSRCTFSHNQDTAVFNGGSAATFSDCRFIGNHATYYGGAIANLRAIAVVQRCIFEDNSAERGGAIANLDGSFTSITQSRFTRNFANVDGGAICDSRGSATLRNTIFTDNDANGYGGALCQYAEGSLELVNCTLTRNTAASLGGGLYLQNGAAQVHNSILWANTVTGPQPGATLEETQVQNDGGTLTASHSLIQGLTTALGLNNHDVDPLFAFGTAVPGALSPAIDRGNNGFVQPGDVDFAGNARQAGSAVDVGAYESATSYGNTLLLAQFLQPVATCDGNVAEFRVVADSGTNYVIQWQRSSGGSFSNLVSGGIYTISTNGPENLLQISPVSTALNGDQFRFIVSSINYTSPAVTLGVAPSSVIYVNQANPTPGNGSSWAQAVNKLSDALNLWSECSEIWVAAGTYVQTNATGEPISLRLRSPMRIYGGFAGTETLRSQRNWSNQVTRIVAAGPALPAFANDGSTEAIDRLAVVDGVIFAGAQAIAVNNFQAGPTFRNCTFASNVVAVANRNGATPLFENCRFLNNSNFLGSPISSIASSPVFSNCVFAGNYSEGGGGAMVFSGGAGTIVESRFENNRALEDGGAIFIFNDGFLDISRSSFISNAAEGEGGGIGVNNSRAQIVNSLLAQNHSGFRGGAVMAWASTVSIVNSTLADNQTGGLGGGMAQTRGTLGVTNSIFWGNSAPDPEGSLEAAQIHRSGGAASVSHSIVAGLQNFAGNNNASHDPLLVQTSAGNYRLQAYSPALNSGTNLAAAGPRDLDGNIRILSSTVDRGAYEFAGAAGSGGPLRLASMPQSVKVCAGAGEAGLFTVTGESNPDIHYHWEINTGSSWGNVATNDGLHSIVTTANSSTLVVSNLTLAQNGNRYRFRITSSLIVAPFYADTNGVLLTVSGPATLFVKHDATGNQSGANWANAFTNLTAALANAASCSEIWVATGTYRPLQSGSNSYAANLKNGVEIYGGFNGTETSRSQRNWTNNPTILRGDYRAAVLSAVGFDKPIGPATVVDGFTFQADGAVSGLSVAQAGPTIRNCRFENLISDALAVSLGASPMVENCWFINNRDTAIDVRDNCLVTISNSVFISNLVDGQGAAIHSTRTSVVSVANSIFAANAAQFGGGAVLNQNGSTFAALNCVFTNNSAALAGAAENIFGTMTFTNCLFADNHSASYGGALANFGNLTLVNCTVADNAAAYGGSGIYQLSATATLRNTILWGNADNVLAFGNLERAQIENVLGTVIASHSIIQGLNLYAGTANLPYDPLFTNAPAGDYRLQTYVSPARNAGNNAFIAGIHTDLAGSPRLFDTTVDIGAYETIAGVATPVQITSHPKSVTNCPLGIVTFTVTGVSGIGNQVSWRVKAPSDSNFLPIDPNFGPDAQHYRIVTNSTSSTLVVSNFSTFNGYQFRYDYATAFDPYRCDPVTLTVFEALPIYVNASAPLGGDGQSWATAYNDLQSALATVSVCRPEIWLAGGTYRPTSGTNRSVVFEIPAGARIYGGFTGNESSLAQRNLANPPSILSGDIGVADDHSDNSIYVVSFNGQIQSILASTVLDGVTVERATGGAGILVAQASPTIRACLARQNLGSGLYVVGGSPRMEQCSFISNTADSGAGASIADATPQFMNCVFSGNTATFAGGGLHAQNSTVNLTNCLVTGNAANGGAGLNFAIGTLNLVNTTIAANRVNGSSGAGLFASGAAVTARNTLFWHNAANGSRAESAQLAFSGGTASVAFCGIQNLSVYAGNQNSNFDPLFAAALAAEAAPAAGGDYRLQSCSPALNAGTGIAIPTDLDGNPRSVNGSDLGAYEYQGAFTTALILLQQPANVTYCAAGSNVFALQLLAAPAGTTARWEVDRHNGSGFVTVFDGYGHSGATSTNLVLTNATAAMDGEDYRLRLQTPLGCVTYSATARLSVPPSRRFVRWNAVGGGDGLSWATAYDDLRLAMQNPCVTELWVAAGPYAPQFANPNAQFQLRDGLSLYGGFNGTETERDQRNWVLNPTVLSGNTGAGNSVNMVTANGTVKPVTNAVRLDGFVLSQSQHALRLDGNVSLTIANCVFTENQNSAYVNQGHARFLQCSFLSNIGTSEPMGIVCHNGGSILAQDCSFRGNSSANPVSVVGINNNSTGEFNNCVFSGNRSAHAAVMNVDSPASVILRNCTLTGNRGNNSFACIYGAPTLINSIVWSNRDFFGYNLDAQIYPAGQVVRITNSCVQSLNLPNTNFLGNGINAAPQFYFPINPTNTPSVTLGDLRVLPCSPARDGGRTADAIGAFDVAGQPRVLGVAVDMGAYESDLGPALSLTSQPADQIGGGQQTLQFAVAAVGTNLTYQWEVKRTTNFVNLANDASHSGATAPVLTLANLSSALNGYQYRCRVRDAFGCTVTSSAATFTFIDYPSVTTVAATDVAFGSARLNMSASSTPPATYYWQYGTTTNYGSFTATNPLPRFALNFNGTNQSGTSAQAIALANASFTIEFWAKRAQMSRDDYFLAQGPGGVPNQTLVIGFRSGNQFTFGFWNNDLDVAGFTDTNWHHWACTFDAGSKMRRIYRDGVQVASATSGVNYTGSGILTIGRLSAIGSFYRGALDDLRIWSGERSAAQIAANKDLSLAGNEAGLLANWKFEEGSGNTALDASPNANTITLVNSPAWINATNTLSLPASGLLAGTTYHFRAVVMNSFGAVYGNDLSFTTLPFFITTQPTNTTVLAGNTASFNVAVNVPAGSGYQWQSRATNAGSFQDIPGATNNTYTTPTLSVADNGTLFRVQIGNGPNLLTSDAAALTVDPVVQITFDSRPAGMEMQVFLNGNFLANMVAPETFTFLPGDQVTVNSLVLSGLISGRYLQFDSWSDGGDKQHTITVPQTDQTYTARYVEVPPNGVIREIWFADGTNVTDLTSLPAYPDSPSAWDLQTALDMQDPFENFGARTRGYMTPPATGEYSFDLSSIDNSELWLSSDENPANAVRIAPEGPSQIQAYEPFDYPEGSLFAQGSSVDGWMGAWFSGGEVVAAGLPYTDSHGIALPQTGNQALMSGNPGATSFRSLAAPLTQGTYWLSCVAQVVTNESPFGYAWVSLWDENFFELARFGKVSIGPTATWGLYAGPTVDTAYAATQRVFLVLRADLGLGPNGSSSLRLWVNPALGAGREPALATADAELLGLGFSPVAMLAIEAGNGASMYIDEIRIGGAYGAVAPGPDNSAITLTAGEKYYFSLLHKVGDSSPNHVTVRWTGPNVTNEIVAVPYLLPLVLSGNPASYVTDQNTSLPITLSGVNPRSGPLAFAIATGPTNGVLSGTPPNLVYTPQASFFGTDSFSFKVNDGEVDSLPASVSITVNAGLFLRLTLDGPDRVLHFNGPPGRTVHIQARPGLGFGTWNALGTAIEESPGSYKFRDASPPASAGFYRLFAP